MFVQLMKFHVLVCFLFALLANSTDATQPKIKDSALVADAQNPPQEMKQDGGQATYEHFCINCHQEGVAGAPKFRNKTDWEPRLANNRTINELVNSAVNGLNTMPPKGTCFECTEEDLRAAIHYMLPDNHD
jgi:cytochrome c5